MTTREEGVIEGQYIYQNELMRKRVAALEAELAEARRPRRRSRPAGVIEDGMYYPIPTPRIWPVIQAVCIGVILAAGILFVLPLLSAPPRTTTNAPPPLGTADVRPTPPRQPAPQDAPAPAAVPLFADATPVPAYDNRAYNATAEAAQPEQEPAEVLIVVTPTALPEPGAPGFEGSFQEPVCSPMIDYLRGHPCYGRVGQQALPQPGDDGFAASFEEPGD
jgi:hypothetical protein